MQALEKSKLPITVTIITLNEEQNISRAIQSVLWANEILIIDSGSSDNTVKIAELLGAKVLYNPWSGYGQQKNFAQNAAKNEWVLNIDADEVVTEELYLELKNKVFSNLDSQFTYAIPRKTFYLGRWILHGGWYPNYLSRLANKNTARWSEPHLHECLSTKTGQVQYLKGHIEHYTFASIEDQILTNLRYSQHGSKDLIAKGQNPSVIKLIFKPFGKFVETYFLKKGCLDGLAGLIISINAAHSMFLKYAYLLEIKINENSRSR